MEYSTLDVRTTPMVALLKSETSRGHTDHIDDSRPIIRFLRLGALILLAKDCCTLTGIIRVAVKTRG